jgi:hypothetical protein
MWSKSIRPINATSAWPRSMNEQSLLIFWLFPLHWNNQTCLPTYVMHLTRYSVIWAGEGGGAADLLQFRPPTFFQSFFLPFLCWPPTTHCRCRSILLCLITLRHTTLGRAPLDEGSARRRALYLTTRKPNQPAVADPGLRPRGHRDRRLQTCKVLKTCRIREYRLTCRLAQR